MKLSADDDRDHQRQLVGDLRREVDVAGGLAADVGAAPWSPSSAAGIVVVAQVFDQARRSRPPRAPISRSP